DREQRDRQVEGGATEEAATRALAGADRTATGDHHVTSLRRMRRSSTALTPPRTGRRNSAIAEPLPRLPPRMPVKNARLARVLVEFAGPPRVRMKMGIMSATVKMNVNKMATIKIGEIIGRMTWNRRLK